jgi:hypothetical protein
MLNVNSPLFIAMATVFATAALAIFGWSAQRIISRIDAIVTRLEGLADQLDVMGNRVTAIETKQNAGVKIARRTANKVGVHLPKELTDTVDPRRPASA